MNSMIPLLGRQAQINDPLETAGNAASLQNLLQVNQMRQRQMDDMDAQQAAQKQRMVLAKRAWDEAMQYYNDSENASRSQAAEQAQNQPVQLPPGAPMPGSANSPIGQGQPAGAVMGPNGAVQEKPVNVTARMPLSDPKFHEIFAAVSREYGLNDISEQAMQHRSELLKEQAPQSEPGKIAADFKNKGPLMEAIGKVAVWQKVKGNPPPGFAWDPDTGDPKPVKEVQDFMMKLREKGATKITNNLINKTEGKYGEVFATEAAKKDFELKTAAENAPAAIERAKRVNKLLTEGDLFTGTGAEFKLGMAKALRATGITIGESTVANTEELASNLARNTLDAIRASGLGGGTGFSNADRDFLEKAQGGKITLDGATIKRLADLNIKAHTNASNAWAKRAKTIPKSALEGTGVEAPAPVAEPQGPPADASPADLIEWYTK